MKIIEKLSDMMEEEMEGAEHYIECALKWKDKGDIVLSKTFYDLSLDELKHASMLHDNSTRLISEYKNKGEIVPPEMEAVYDYLHEKHIERFNDIKLKQATYRG